MCITIAITSQKGGVGKTTIAINIAGILSEKDKRVILVDLDPQCNLSNTLIDNNVQNRKSVFDLIVDENTQIEETITNMLNSIIIKINNFIKKFEGEKLCQL